jgi:hypothetical protein
LALDTRRLITATLFGVAIAIVKGPFPPPYADLLIVVEAPLLGLSFLIIGRGGATYTELVNGLLQSVVKASFFPFDLLVAILYGVLVDVLGTIFKVRGAPRVSTRRMIATLGISSIIVGGLAAYTSIVLGIVAYNASLFEVVYVPIIGWGIFSGALGGFVSARVWEQNLRARFRSLQPQVG